MILTPMLGLLTSVITWPFRLVGSVISSILVLLTVVTGLLSIGGFFGLGIGEQHQWAAVLDLMSHLRLQYLYVLTFCLAGFFLLRDRAWMVMTALLIGLNLYEIVPYYWPADPVRPLQPPHEAVGIKLMQFNVLKTNRQSEAVARYIREVNPDIIALEEVDTWWAEQLTILLPQYRYKKLVPQENYFGVALLSKYPITQATVLNFGQTGEPAEPWGIFSHFFKPEPYPTISATVQLPARLASVSESSQEQSQTMHQQGSTRQGERQAVQVLLTHPLPPFAGFDIRNKHLMEMAEYVRKLKIPVIVMGDLNTTPWSVYYKQFLKVSGLKETQRGHGIQPTWPNIRPLLGPLTPLAMIPIDYVLVTPGLPVATRQTGSADLGSDHLPVIVELGLRK